jgi:hypothetical protein
MSYVELNEIKKTRDAAIHWPSKAAWGGVKDGSLTGPLRAHESSVKAAAEDMMPGNRDEDLDYDTLTSLRGAKKTLEDIDHADMWPQEGPYDYYSCIFKGADPNRHGGKQRPTYNKTAANNAVEATQLLLNQAEALLDD